MAMGRRKRDGQKRLWVPAGAVAQSPGHPFYERLNELLDEAGFDEHVEALCSKFYAERMGRPSLAPAVYFRLQLIGYFERIDSERGIGWRVADSLALRQFLGYELQQSTPDHSTISRTRRLIDLETHREVFVWVLGVLAKHDLLKGKTLGVDSTTLEANAALRSIVRRDTGQGYEEFLSALAQESGIDTPTRQQLAKLDRKRKGKGSNDDWQNPHDPDATITKMKDGRTHLAHGADQVVDMETTAVVAVNVSSAIAGDTQTVQESYELAVQNLKSVRQDPEANEHLSQQLARELVADKGFHSNDVLSWMQQLGVRTYISEPDRGGRRWKGKPEAQRATYENRRRMKRAKGQRLQRQRGERLERNFANQYPAGGMRRAHLRGRCNILKRILVHVAAGNLGLVMRQQLGAGTPRGLQGRLASTVAGSLRAIARLWALADANVRAEVSTGPYSLSLRRHLAAALIGRPQLTSATAC
jgi:transposase